MGWLEKLDGARDGLIRKVRWSQGWVGQKSQMELGMGWLEKLDGARDGLVRKVKWSQDGIGSFTAHPPLD